MFKQLWHAMDWGGGRQVTVPRGLQPVSRLPLPILKQQIAAVLADCEEAGSHTRMICRINSAACATDLWLLRCDVYQFIARAHGQRVARLRINGLLPYFEGWLPRCQLMRV